MTTLELILLLSAALLDALILSGKLEPAKVPEYQQYGE
jgi:hypothetical protein